MFYSIGWGAYWTFLALLTTLYYTAIILFYFLHDRKNTTVGTVPYLPADERKVHACLDELNAFFEQAKKRRWQKTELQFALQSLLSKFAFLRDSEYRDVVTSMVGAQSESVCHIHFSAEELRQVWVEK